MPRVMKICKECGKEYEACHTPNPGIFRWRDIACSYECAQEYVRKVMEARGATISKPDEETKSEYAPAETTENNVGEDGEQENEQPVEHATRRNMVRKK